MGPGSVAWWQAVSKTWADPVFSLFLAPFSKSAHAYDPKPGGGSLILGGTDPSYYTGNFTWVDADTTTGWWALGLEGASFGGSTQIPMKVNDDFCIDNKPVAMLDSGATMLSIPHSAAEVIYPALGMRTVNGLDLIPSDNRTGPSASITFTIGGQDYPVPAVWGCDTSSNMANAFGLGNGDLQGRDYWCVPNTIVNDKQMWVLGAPFLQSVYSVFSVAPTIVGFARLSSGASVDGTAHISGEGDDVAPTSGSGSSAAGRRGAPLGAVAGAVLAVLGAASLGL